jgi:choice-of-anchor B domain-containing protein
VTALNETYPETDSAENKTTRHITHCEKQAMEYNNTHVNRTLVPSVRSDVSDSIFAPQRSAESSSNEAVSSCAYGGYAYDQANRVRYPCHNVDMLSFIPLVTMHEAVNWKYGSDDGYGKGSDLYGWTYANSGREFALMGMAYGISIVEVTDPIRPRYLGLLAATDYKKNLWKDIKVKGDVAYVVSEQPDHGLQMFDLTRLLDLSPSYARVLEPDKVLRGESWFNTAHNLVVNRDDEESNLLIAVGVDTRFCKGGMFIMDIVRPLLLAKRTCFGDDGYVHDAECVTYRGPDPDFQGREICFAYNEDAVAIVDVTTVSGGLYK